MSFSARLVCVGLGVLAVACADAPSVNISSREEAVTGGEVSGQDDDFVVRVVSRQPEPYWDAACSGTLLAPNLVLTALQCVTVFDALGEFSCRDDGSLAPSPSGGWIGETLDPERIEVYFGTEVPLAVAAHATRILGTGSTVVCVDNIALVVLDTALPVGKVPVRLDRPVVEGESMTVIGYGLNDSPGTLRARRSGVPVLAVGPDDTSGGIGTTAPRTFVGGDGPCGDSGAPALSDETGAVTGLFLYTFSGDCTQPGTRGSFTKLAPFGSLVRQAFELAGQTPMLEALPATQVPKGSRASCTVNAGQVEPGLLAPAFGALVVLLARRTSARARSVRSKRRS